jgi:ParB-like chromosome segregation protein Spo0J
MNAANAISEHDRKLIERYQVQIVPVNEINPSPENNEVYGPANFDNDPALHTLVRSIARLGLEEPLIVTKDNYVLSGHRRLFAVRELGWATVPVRFANVTRADATDYHRLLTEYNPQRIKSVAATLAEKLLQPITADNGRAWAKYHEARSNSDIKLMQVNGEKPAEPVGPRKQEFLTAAQEIIEDLRPYWPLSVRQVHYKLLNSPPLTQTTKKRNERWRYRNDLANYNKLSGLLVSARYEGSVAWNAIDDATRESKIYYNRNDVAEFIEEEVGDFLTGYTLDRMEGQPDHVELIVEKNTLLNIVSDIAANFHIPVTALRGYGGPSLWREIEERWRYKVENHTGPNPPKCVLIIVSDHDPEGLNLPDDAVRSLRDRHGVEVIATRPAITMEQVERYKLPSNPANDESTRYDEYVKRAGTKRCWEVEALDPEVLRKCVYDAILEVIDVDQLNAVQEREAEEKQDIAEIRSRLGTKLQEMMDDSP